LGFLVSRLLAVPSALAVVLVFALPALEASIFLGFVFPGETAVVLGGVLAAEGKVPVWLVGAVAAAGAIVGDSVGYWVGARWGRGLLRRIPRRLVKPETVDRAVEFVQRRGGIGVFIGRFTTALRVLVPGAAGLSDMTYRRFLVANALGGIAWAGLYTGLGYAAGANYRVVLADASTTSGVVLGIVVAAVVIFAVYRHFHLPKALSAPVEADEER
jgi:membrane-associated protein